MLVEKYNLDSWPIFQSEYSSTWKISHILSVLSKDQIIFPVSEPFFPLFEVFFPLHEVFFPGSELFILPLEVFVPVCELSFLPGEVFIPAIDVTFPDKNRNFPVPYIVQQVEQAIR